MFNGIVICLMVYVALKNCMDKETLCHTAQNK